MCDELAAVPEADRVAVPGVRAVHVLVLLADVDAADAGPKSLIRYDSCGRLMNSCEYGLEQPPRIARRLAVRQTIVLDLAELLLLAPALSVGLFIRRRQHSLANLAGKPWRIDEAVHVGIAGGHPQAVPARHGRERVLRPAFGGREEKLVVLVRRGEGLRRRHDRERRSIPASERSGLRDEHRRRADEREGGNGDQAEALVEIHGNSKLVEDSQQRHGKAGVRPCVDSGAARRTHSRDASPDSLACGHIVVEL